MRLGYVSPQCRAAMPFYETEPETLIRLRCRFSCMQGYYQFGMPIYKDARRRKSEFFDSRIYAALAGERPAELSRKDFSRVKF